eukprot:GHVS01067023.1.p2 GENE.GHVS01067023.1~~GHVS01067023.1.p2  ORF type:complete len:125 (+),score=7.18 GHVS01067023.1:166-540(+)
MLLTSFAAFLHGRLPAPLPVSLSVSSSLSLVFLLFLPCNCCLWMLRSHLAHLWRFRIIMFPRTSNPVVVNGGLPKASLQGGSGGAGGVAYGCPPYLLPNRFGILLCVPVSRPVECGTLTAFLPP